MRVYVAVAARRTTTGLSGGLSGAVEDAARASLPFETVQHDRWEDRDGTRLVAAWSNEPGQPDRPLLSRKGAGVRGFSGYLTDDPPTVAEIATAGADLGVGGVWSLFAADGDRVAATTCASGVESVFYAVTDDLVVVGNRALLVHLVVQPDGPVADLVGLAGVLNSGYCVTDRTAFEGVRCLAPGSRVTCDREGRVEVGTYGDDLAGATAVDVTQALVSSVAPLRALGQPVRLGLTGGRDSRLLAALLVRAGVPVVTHTSGLSDDPDVVVAGEVASRLGVTHQVGPPKGARVEDGTVTFDVRSRVREAVVLGEGMLSAYDRVGRIDDHYNATTAPFAGSGGELLRAYYGGSFEGLRDREAVVRVMRSRMRRTVKRMTPSARAAYEADTEPWSTLARHDGVASLEEFYVRQRLGRWTGAARGSASIGSLARRPYLDHRVVRAVRGVALADRTGERFVADVLDELSPGLADLRFAGRRWEFDDEPPADADDAARCAWERRAPVRNDHGDEPGFNWRTDVPEVRQELADIITGAPDVFWELVDRRRVTEFVSRTHDRTRGDTVTMWHLATVAAALTHDFYVGPARFDRSRHEAAAARPAVDARAGQAGNVVAAARSVARSAARLTARPTARPTARATARRVLVLLRG
jgi:hypothetical protein